MAARCGAGTRNLLELRLTFGSDLLLARRVAFVCGLPWAAEHDSNAQLSANNRQIARGWRRAPTCYAPKQQCERVCHDEGMTSVVKV